MKLKNIYEQEKNSYKSELKNNEIKKDEKKNNNDFYSEVIFSSNIINNLY